MAPKVAIKKPTAKKTAKAKAQGKGKTKATPPSKAAVQGQASKASSSTSAGTGAEEEAPTAGQLRSFKKALDKAPAHAQAVVDSALKLGFGQGKRAQYQKLAVAFAQSGWQHACFNSVESVEGKKKATESEVCYPRPVMIGHCGGLAHFNDGLASGDIEEVERPRHPGRFFYKYTTFTEAKSTSHKKALTLKKDKPLEDFPRTQTHRHIHTQAREQHSKTHTHKHKHTQTHK